MRGCLLLSCYAALGFSQSSRGYGTVLISRIRWPWWQRNSASPVRVDASLPTTIGLHVLALRLRDASGFH